MGQIPFTQYKLPDGRPVDVAVERPDPIFAKAQKIIDAGHRFECEVLMTGMVSLTIACEDEEEGTIDLDIEVCENGPEILEAVDRLIERFDQQV